MNKHIAVPPKSPANPLPTAFCGPKFRCRQARPIVDNPMVDNAFLMTRGCFSSAAMRFLPDSREKRGRHPRGMPASSVGAGWLEIVHAVHAAAMRHGRHGSLFRLFGDH